MSRSGFQSGVISFARNTPSLAAAWPALATEPGPLDLRHNLSCCAVQFGADTVWLARFVEWVQKQLNANSGNRMAGVGATILGARSNSFMVALRQYQDALVKLNQHSRVGRGPAATRAHLQQKVRNAYENLNKHFQQELQRLAPAKDFGKNKGSAITSADRGITLAERHQGRGIHIADMHEGRAVSGMSQRLAYAGNGLLAIDIVFRGDKVHQKYQDGEDWKREFAVQAGGFGGSWATGFASGRAVALTMARVALAATPWGWFLMVGSSCSNSCLCGQPS